jgi:hypothetical protein
MIVWFVQRWAFLIAMLAGSITYSLLLPDDAPMWLELVVWLGVSIPLYLLLYKDGVTANRPRRSKSDFR